MLLVLSNIILNTDQISHIRVGSPNTRETNPDRPVHDFIVDPAHPACSVWIIGTERRISLHGDDADTMLSYCWSAAFNRITPPLAVPAQERIVELAAMGKSRRANTVTETPS